MHAFCRTILACVALTTSFYSPHALRADDVPTTTPAVIEPADFHKVKDAMPKTFAGVARENASGQRIKAGETAFSTVEADYGKNEGDAPRTAKITTIDYGNPEMAKGMAVWLANDLDQESDKEYTKTADVQGRRALLTYNTEEKRGTVQTLAGGRMIVTLEVHGLTDDEFKKAADELPLKALDALVTGGSITAK